MAEIELVEFKDYGKYATFIYENATKDEVSNAVSNALLAQGYKLESGVPENGIFGIGNKTMRLLFGAFAKRYVYSVHITEKEGKIKFDLLKADDGSTGGVIGYNKANKEYLRLTYTLKSQVGVSKEKK